MILLETFLLLLSLKVIFIDCEKYDCVTVNERAKQGHQRAGFSKLLITGGITDPQIFSESVEVLNLSDNLTKCDPLPNLDFTTDGAIAGYDNENNPIICGGFSQSTRNECYSLSEGSWTHISSLNEGRRFAGSLNIPKVGLFVLGGESFPLNLNSSEILTNYLWKITSPTPDPISRNCMVMLGDQTVFAIGGWIGGQHYSERTFELNINSQSWIKGIPLKTGREFHSCSTIRSKQSSRTKIIVVGGRNKDVLKSTEVFYPTMKTWSRGPSLPKPIYFSNLVEDPLGGVILVGGHNGFKSIRDLYFLKDLSEGSDWVMMAQKLSKPRRSHVVLPIPDDMTLCNDPELTTTAATSPLTTEEDTTRFRPLVYSKLLVALGKNQHGSLDHVEIVDLSSSSSNCQALANFPFKAEKASGGLEFQDQPIICGGLVDSGDSSSECYTYEDRAWKSVSSLNEVRHGFAMTRSPFKNDGSKLFVTGGHQGGSISLSSSEILTESGWKFSIPLEANVYGHCMVWVNSTTVMVIGGNYDNLRAATSRVYVFNALTNIWSEGPQLKTARNTHTCGMISKSGNANEKSIIVVGGYGTQNNILDSVEVFDDDSNEWREGPPLPMPIVDPVLVEDSSSGAVVLVGGFNDVPWPVDTLYKLAASDSPSWDTMPQTLKTARGSHTAFLIPDGIAECIEALKTKDIN